MNIKKLVKNRENINSLMKIFSFIPDEPYLKLMYRLRMGEKLDLNNPQTFNEKLQWLKLHDRRPEYTMMVDKYEVKKYVASIIGNEYIIPTLGVWDHFDEIDFDSLPNRFVLKCTHDSGGLVICKDKSTLDMKKAKKKIERSLKCNFYWVGREWPYKNVKPRIIAEKYLEDEPGIELKDYKLYCFNGKAGFLYLSQGLTDHSTARINFVTLDWRPAKYTRNDYAEFEILPARPQKLDEMIKLGEMLSNGIPFCRTDFYEVDGQVLFGELTFSPGSGFTPFEEEEYDREIGSFLTLPINE